MKFYLSNILFIFFYASTFASLSILLKNKSRIIVFTFCYLFFTSYFLLQALHFTVFKNFVLVSKIPLIKEALDVKDVVDFKIGVIHLLYIIPTTSIFLIYCYKHMKEKKLEINKKSFYKRKNNTYIRILIILILVYTMLNKIYSIADTDESFLRKEIIDSNDFISRYGFMDFVINDITKSIKESIPFIRQNSNNSNLKQLDTYFNERSIEKDSSNEMSKIFKDKNLILITSESFAPYGINKELTKTLYKLKETGIYFDNYYSSNVGTIDTEFTMLTSLIPTYNKGRVSYTYANNASKFTMPSMFKANGYTTMAFHNYWDKYYNRKLYMPTLGFDSYKGMESLEIPKIEEGLDDFPKDIDLFRNSFDDYMNEEKFFAYYMTVSGHGAYYEERISLLEDHQKVEKLYGDTLPYTTKYYLASQMQLDKGIEYLLSKLEETGLIENTVIVIVGDHYPYLIGDDEIREVFNIEDELDLYKIPFIIWSKDIESKLEDRIMTTLDILPTLGNMFDINTRYSMGVDVYNSSVDSMVRWNNQRAFSFLNKDIYYDRSIGKTKYNGNASEEDAKRILRRNYEEFLFSKWIIETNYFATK